MPDEFDAVKEDLRQQHSRFLSLLRVLREHGLSADEAARTALAIDSKQPESAKTAAVDERESAARRVETGRYDIDVTAVDGYDDVVKQVVRQAADHIRCGLGRTT